MSARVVQAAARGIVLKSNPSLLSENGSPVELSKEWAHKLLRRMGFVNWKATTSKSHMSVCDFEDTKKEFLQEIVDIAMIEEVPPELILNWDQTGINVVPSSGWTMEQRGATWIEVTGVDDKRQITAVLCGSLTGDFLPLKLVYGGKNDCCNPRSKLPSDWDITHAPKHWSTKETTEGYVENIVLPYIRRRELL